MNDFIARRAPSLALGLLLISIVSALLVPLYSDEITWRFQLGRVLQDGWVDRFVGDSCGPRTYAQPPMFMWPVRLASSAMTLAFSDPRVVRTFGVILALATVFLFRAILRSESFRDKRLETLAYLFLGLGILPWILAMSRPEQPILICILGAVVLTVSRSGDGEFELVRPGLIALFALIAMCFHLKALFYLPTFLLCLWMVSVRRLPLWIPVGCTMIVLAAAGSAFIYWSSRFQCPGDPILQRTLNHENLTSVLVTSGLPGMIERLPSMFYSSLPTHYAKLAAPSYLYTSTWLPPLPIPWIVMKSWRVIVILLWVAAVIFGAFALIRAVKRRGPFDERLMIGMSLALGLLGWGALQTVKNSYEAALYLPLLLLVIALFIAASDVSPRRLAQLVIPVGVISIATQLALGVLYGPQLVSKAGSKGYVANQRFSFAPWTYETYKQRVLRAAAACQITPSENLKHLLVDDGTYFVFAQSFQPLHYVGITESWRGSIVDPGDYLRRVSSSGAVLSCQYLAAFPRTRSRSIETDGICCWPGQQGDGRK